MLAVSQTYAGAVDAIELSEPQMLCFDKSVARGDLTQFTFDYNFVTPEKDLGKEGLIFMGFRLKSNPNSFYLLHGYGQKNWSLYEPGKLLPNGAGEILRPLAPLRVVSEPTNLSAFIDDGEILVGYGLKVYEEDTQEDIFQEMLSYERYSVVRPIKPNMIDTRRICIDYTHIRESSGLFGLPAPVDDSYTGDGLAPIEGPIL